MSRVPLQTNTLQISKCCAFYKIWLLKNDYKFARFDLIYSACAGSGFNQLADSYEPGNLGFDPLGLLNGKSEEEKKVRVKPLVANRI